jgi:DNA replication and repair protein RecF
MTEAAAPPLRLDRLTLTDVRSYADLTWRPQGRLSVIVGPNGAGKTNLLEAVSLLVPGRGLRNARLPNILRRGAERWAVAAHLTSPSGPFDLGTGTPPGGPAERRVFLLDGATPRSQAEIASRLAMVWLTPQMDRLFQDSASGRRRFLDRLVWALEPGHARTVAAYDPAMASRNRLLAEGRADAAWLAGLEDAMARHAVAASVARRALVARLNAVPAPPDFPAARMVLRDVLADRLADGPALAAEEWLRGALAGSRDRDRAAGGAAFGAHRADMDLELADTGTPAGLASTGEQHALLVSVILAHAALIAAARGFAPILLLDEPAVHLDDTRRGALFAALANLPAQVLMTGPDAAAFAPLSGMAEVLRAGDGNLRPEPGFPRLGAD